MENDFEYEKVTIHDIVQVIRKQWLKVILLFICGILVMFVYGNCIGQKKYESTGVVHISSETKDGKALSEKQILANHEYLKDAEDLMKSDSFVKKVNKEVPELSSNEIRDALVVDYKEDTNIIQIGANGKTPEQGEKIAKAFINEFVEDARKNNNYNVQVYQQPVQSNEPTNFSFINCLKIGAVLGVVLDVLYIVIKVNLG